MGNKQSNRQKRRWLTKYELPNTLTTNDRLCRRKIERNFWNERPHTIVLSKTRKKILKNRPLQLPRVSVRGQTIVIRGHTTHEHGIGRIVGWQDTCKSLRERWICRVRDPNGCQHREGVVKTRICRVNTNENGTVELVEVAMDGNEDTGLKAICLLFKESAIGGGETDGDDPAYQAAGVWTQIKTSPNILIYRYVFAKSSDLPGTLVITGVRDCYCRVHCKAWKVWVWAKLTSRNADWQPQTSR